MDRVLEEWPSERAHVSGGFLLAFWGRGEAGGRMGRAWAAGGSAWPKVRREPGAVLSGQRRGRGAELSCPGLGCLGLPPQAAGSCLLPVLLSAQVWFPGIGGLSLRPSGLSPTSLALRMRRVRPCAS